MENMRVNRLPSFTWNALRMNDSRISEAKTNGSAQIVEKCSEGILKKIPENDLGKIETIETGMGPDLDALRRESGTEPLCFLVPEEKKEQVLRLSAGRVGKENAFLPVEILASEGSDTTIYMDYETEGKMSGTLAVQTRIFLERNARVRLVQLQTMDSGDRSLNDIGAVCGDGAHFEILQLFLGAGETYAGCRVELAGKGSSVAAEIGYLGRENQKYDFNYAAMHEGKKTQSEINASGVLWDHASKLFRGTIDFRNGSSGSAGNEKEDVLLMNEGVVNRTIPLILCAEEDVEGNHGASIGKLDDELLFYLVSRGMSRQEACRMIARARIDALGKKTGDRSLRQKVTDYLEEVFHE